MSTYSVTLKRELDDDFLMDVMVTMIESGMHSIHYWGTVSNLVRRTVDLMPERFIVREDEDDDHIMNRVLISPQVVARAIDRILNDESLVGPIVRGYIVDAVALLDAGTIDAEAADCIAQVAVLGEVRYG